ncbi:MAG: hypothetical protein KatS3mg060_1186 [Dehalococcoidia bacterium]|nr:MAG: hypothetical protein KatS3mg060_1186 [Dehalococcoidia bacterium]
MTELPADPTVLTVLTPLAERLAQRLGRLRAQHAAAARAREEAAQQARQRALATVTDAVRQLLGELYDPAIVTIDTEYLLEGPATVQLAFPTLQERIAVDVCPESGTIHGIYVRGWYAPTLDAALLAAADGVQVLTNEPW